MDLFDSASEVSDERQPLAARMRPTTPDDVVGQSKALGQGGPLGPLLANPNRAVSVILWGPPGAGKTSIARLLADRAGQEFHELSAVSATVKDVRAVIEGARLSPAGTVLFVDEVHRFSKTQQDALLPAVENGWVTFVGATTENPSFAVIPALLSRSILVTLVALADADIAELLARAVHSPNGLADRVALSPEAQDYLVRYAGGDARKALTALEAAASAARPRAEGPDAIDLAVVEAAVQQAAPKYDRAGTRHYDVASALIKSIRGSDVDAALHYLAIMVVAGEDPRFIARRLLISASEDIGMADPTALPLASAAATAVATVGWPEARIILAQTTVHLALAPKSNAVYQAINAAVADVNAGKGGTVPDHLRDGSTKSARATGAGQGYVYPHDLPTGLAAQQYLPVDLAEADYYHPTQRGREAAAATLWAQIRSTLHVR